MIITILVFEDYSIASIQHDTPEAMKAVSVLSNQKDFKASYVIEIEANKVCELHKQPK